MLYQLGPLAVKVAPFNVDTVQKESSTDYVPKPVLGAEPPLEYVGEGGTTFRLSGALFPKAIGGLSELDMLDQMRESGEPQFLLRGDGKPLGWVAITRVSERSEHLGSDGVGRKVSVDIELRRASAPSALSLFTLLLGFFT